MVSFCNAEHTPCKGIGQNQQGIEEHRQYDPGQDHVFNCGLLIDNGDNIKIIHQPIKGSDKINRGNSPGEQDRHPDIIIEHEGRKDVACHGCKVTEIEGQP